MEVNGIKERKKKQQREKSNLRDDIEIINLDDTTDRYTKNPTVRKKRTNSKNNVKSSPHTKSKYKTLMYYKKIGFSILALQLIASIFLVSAIIKLNYLPNVYVFIISIVLLVILGVFVAFQWFAKNKALISKSISILVSISLLFGAFYVHRASTMMESITTIAEEMVDNIVIAVRVEDNAETLEDTREYEYGVQYTVQGHQIDETVLHIQEILDETVSTVQYYSLVEQADALLNNEVDAIIYNQAYGEILQEENSTFSSSIKIIYTYEIRTPIDVEDVDTSLIAEPFAIYLSGIDVYGDISTNSRSDANLILFINPLTRQILIVNTPRDSFVVFPGVTGDDKDKLTHAGIYGVRTSMASLEYLYSTIINQYIRINFTSLTEIIDALGGLTVYSEEEFLTNANHGDVIEIKEGYNDLGGLDTLLFCRQRYTLTDGDNQRGRNHQAVVTALIQKLLSPAILTGANKIIYSVSGNVETNIWNEGIQELIKFQLTNGGNWNIQSISLLGEPAYQECYSHPGEILYTMEVNQESVEYIKSVIDLLYEGEILTEEMMKQ